MCIVLIIVSEYSKNAPITVTSQWTQWRFTSPASRLCTLPFIQAQIKENIKAPVTVEFPAQMASNMENIPIWWRHHANNDIWLKYAFRETEYKPASTWLYFWYTTPNIIHYVGLFL